MLTPLGVFSLRAARRPLLLRLEQTLGPSRSHLVRFPCLLTLDLHPPSANQVTSFPYRDTHYS